MTGMRTASMDSPVVLAKTIELTADGCLEPGSPHDYEGVVLLVSMGP
jgi:hypothetical protein